MKYPVTRIFYSLQGEGRFTGHPMTFVRLAGCSVKNCHIRAECDEAPWKASEGSLSVDEIAGRIPRLSNIVCITGGEPTDHDLLPLICGLQKIGMRIHMETSGIRSVAGYPLEWLTVSPKDLNGLVQRTGHALKIVVKPEWSDDEAWDIIDNLSKGTDFFHRYLQPMTFDNRSNASQVTRMLLSAKNDGRWALSTQAHRVWSLP